MKSSLTIGRIYHFDPQTQAGTSLIKCYNSILVKKREELDVGDVATLLRQGFFADIAVPKAIALIEQNHAAGEQYDYELLINLSESKIDLSPYRSEVGRLIDSLIRDSSIIVFDIESDKEDYFNSIAQLKRKI